MAAMSLTLPPDEVFSEAIPQSLRLRSLYVTLSSKLLALFSPDITSSATASSARLPVEMEEHERLGGVGGRVRLRGRAVAND